MNKNITDLLPTSKMDTDKAESIVALGYPAIEPILPQIFEWVKDSNWPVARIFEPFLAKIGSPIAPHIQHVLGSTDGQWKYFVILNIIGKSLDLTNLFIDDLKRIAQNPTDEEKGEELDQIAEVF